MPSERDIQIRYARYYLTVLREAEAVFTKSNESADGLTRLDLDWSQIQNGQIYVAKLSSVDIEAAKICSSYPDVTKALFKWKLPSRIRTQWLEDALNALQRLKHAGETPTDDHFSSPEIDIITRMRQVSPQMAGIVSRRHGAIMMTRGETLGLNKDGYFIISRGQYRISSITSTEIDNLNELADSYRQQRRYQDAIKHCYKGLKLVKQLNGEAKYAYKAVFWGELGIIYADLGQYSRSTSYYKMALKSARQGKYRLCEANQLTHLAMNYYDLEDYRKANQYLQQALPLHRELGFQMEESSTLNELGNIQHKLRDFSGALTYHHQALSIAEKLEAKQVIPYYLLNVAGDYYSIGEFDDALKYGRQAVEMARQTNVILDNAMTRLDLRNARISAGEIRPGAYEQDDSDIARLYANQNTENIKTSVDLNSRGNLLSDLYYKIYNWLSAMLSIRNSKMNAEVIGKQGIALLQLGKYERAAKCFRQAIENSSEIGDTHNLIIWHSYLGGSCYGMARYNEAVYHLEQALEFAAENEATPEIMLTFNFLGLTYAELGQARLARQYYEQAINTAITIKHPDYALSGNLALLSIDLGEYNDAILGFQKILPATRAYDDILSEANQLGNLGNAYIGLGDFHSAIKHLKQSLNLLNSVVEPRMQNYMGGYLGRAYLHDKQLQNALTTVETARRYSNPANDHHLAVLNGLILTHTAKGNDAARQAFNQTLDFTTALLNHSPDYFRAKYSRALALTGLALLAKGRLQEDLLSKAQEMYQSALINCDLNGVREQAVALLSELEFLDPEHRLRAIEELLLIRQRDNNNN